jgi:hypothetical protein
MRSRTLFRLALWLAVAFTLLMAWLPKPPAVPFDPPDKVQHSLAFAVLTFLASVAYPNLRPGRRVAVLAGLGALIELVQAIPALHRDAEFLDWAADMAAILAVTLCVALWKREPLVPEEDRAEP